MVILLWIICPFQEVFTMARKSYTTEQIIGLLRQAEVMLSQGKTLDTVIREIGVTRNIYLTTCGGLVLQTKLRLNLLYI